MTIERTNAGINKMEGAGKMDAQIMSAKALQLVLPTTVASYSNFVAGSIRIPGATECR